MPRRQTIDLTQRTNGKPKTDRLFEPTSDEPTPRQLEVLTFMRQYLLDNGLPPTLREIMIAIDVHSPNGVNCHLQSLKRKGLIRSAGYGKSRGWLPVVDEGCCPTCGQVLEAKS